MTQTSADARFIKVEGQISKLATSQQKTDTNLQIFIEVAAEAKAHRAEIDKRLDRDITEIKNSLAEQKLPWWKVITTAVVIGTPMGLWVDSRVTPISDDVSAINERNLLYGYTSKDAGKDHDAQKGIDERQDAEHARLDAEIRRVWERITLYHKGEN